MGADTNTRFMNPADQRTYPFVRDGAGSSRHYAPVTPKQGLLCYQLGADGGRRPAVGDSAGGYARAGDGLTAIRRGRNFVHMDGRSVSVAVRALTDTVQLVPPSNNRTQSEDVSLYVLHQANQRIMMRPSKRWDSDRAMFSNIQRYGNKSGASVPIALTRPSASDAIHAATRCS